ncbi:MAG: MBL fold metallo-hydrolase [Pseudomonadota bacterium]
MSLDESQRLGAGIAYPHGDAIPGPGEAIEVAPRILWLRLPLPLKLDHVNIYALDEGDSWTIVDTGFQSEATSEHWAQLLDGPLRGKPIKRIVVTHHHPDHIGNAGWFQTEHDAELITTRTAWLMARAVMGEDPDVAFAAQIKHMTRAGAPKEMLELAEKRRGFFSGFVHPLPPGFTRIKEGDRIEMAGRWWRVFIGNGHAPEHATFWSADGELVIGGDQILPKISPNLGVYSTEPGADPVSEWIEACEKFTKYAKAGHLVLPGHNRPFTGLPKRLDQLIDNHHGALKRLAGYLSDWRSAVDCFDTMYKRSIHPNEFGLAMGESIAHLNHLHASGAAEKRLDDDGVFRFRMKGE